MTYANLRLCKKPSSQSAPQGIYCGTGLTQGRDSITMSDVCRNSMEHFLWPVSRQWADPYTRFVSLKAEWQADTSVLSSITETSMHPAYQQIIGMGPVAIPFILDELRREPDDWFWALKSITGEDPVLPEQRGDMDQMAQAW